MFHVPSIFPELLTALYLMPSLHSLMPFLLGRLDPLPDVLKAGALVLSQYFFEGRQRHERTFLQAVKEVELKEPPL